MRFAKDVRGQLEAMMERDHAHAPAYAPGRSNTERVRVVDRSSHKEKKRKRESPHTGEVPRTDLMQSLLRII